MVCSPLLLAQLLAPVLTMIHGGTLPRVPKVCCRRQISLATRQGFFSPAAAPTAPQSREVPSITDASHSTVPSQVRLEPNPAFVIALSSSNATASVAASKADLPSIMSEVACKKIFLIALLIPFK